MDTNNPFLDIVLLSVGGVLGISGEALDTIDVLLGIALKFVSVISFGLVIVLNWKKIRAWGRKKES